MAASDKKVKGQQTLKLQEFSRPELPPVYNFNFYIKKKIYYYEISFWPSPLFCRIGEGQFTGECCPSCPEYPILWSNHFMGIKIHYRIHWLPRVVSSSALEKPQKTELFHWNVGLEIRDNFPHYCQKYMDVPHSRIITVDSKCSQS